MDIHCHCDGFRVAASQGDRHAHATQARIGGISFERLTGHGIGARRRSPSSCLDGAHDRQSTGQRDGIGPREGNGRPGVQNPFRRGSGSNGEFGQGHAII